MSADQVRVETACLCAAELCRGTIHSMKRGSTAALLCPAVLVLLTGCDQFDTVSGFEFVNDAAKPVIVKQCGNTRPQVHEVDFVAPGQSVPYNAMLGRPNEDFLIFAGSETPLGCLSVLIQTRPRHEPSVAVGPAHSCTAAQLAQPSLWVGCSSEGGPKRRARDVPGAALDGHHCGGEREAHWPGGRHEQ